MAGRAATDANSSRTTRFREFDFNMLSPTSNWLSAAPVLTPTKFAGADPQRVASTNCQTGTGVSGVAILMNHPGIKGDSLRLKR
eukprot:CAMPEP_0184322790 /NCGR_PEP_ID=MMETSP1049-20130417/126550_1 /TAXON_ID=77928 /ORGANISM="Proteomonas sulcata, Strain CCMP704" /LENGTH=83 /DNA_ID=CAMNT_0026644045 /DNA_START=150 /DNA_END=401 /DNA_ORIENTATION=-